MLVVHSLLFTVNTLPPFFLHRTIGPRVRDGERLEIVFLQRLGIFGAKSNGWMRIGQPTACIPAQAAPIPLDVSKHALPQETSFNQTKGA